MLGCESSNIWFLWFYVNCCCEQYPLLFWWMTRTVQKMLAASNNSWRTSPKSSKELVSDLQIVCDVVVVCVCVCVFNFWKWYKLCLGWGLICQMDLEWMGIGEKKKKKQAFFMNYSFCLHVYFFRSCTEVSFVTNVDCDDDCEARKRPVQYSSWSFWRDRDNTLKFFVLLYRNRDVTWYIFGLTVNGIRKYQEVIDFNYCVFC